MERRRHVVRDVNLPDVGVLREVTIRTSVSSMPDNFKASVIISSVIVWVPASCRRAQTIPGASVEPRPTPAK
jgi:hypothetical protein